MPATTDFQKKRPLPLFRFPERLQRLVVNVLEDEIRLSRSRIKLVVMVCVLGEMQCEALR